MNLTPYEELEILVRRAREQDKNFDIIMDQILVLCRGYMAPGISEVWMAYGLTVTEGRVMSLLLARSPTIMSPDAIIDAVYYTRPNNIPQPKIIDIFVHKIRHKLFMRSAPFWIETVWGQGYRAHRGAVPKTLPKDGRGRQMYREYTNNIPATLQRMQRRAKAHAP